VAKRRFSQELLFLPEKDLVRVDNNVHGLAHTNALWRERPNSRLSTRRGR